MQVATSALRAEKFVRGVSFVFPIEDFLQPHFVNALLLPVRKNTDAVSRSLDFVEVICQLRERQIFVNVLLHLKSRLDVKRDFGDDPESA